MDIVLKKVSVSSLILLKFAVEYLIHQLESEVNKIECDYNSCPKYSKDFYRDMLKDKKADLDTMRSLFKQL